MSVLYRVTVKTTASLQPFPQETYWSHDVVYCGYDVDEARRVYHQHELADYSYGHGNGQRATLFERLDTAGLADDEAGNMAASDPDAD